MTEFDVNENLSHVSNLLVKKGFPISSKVGTLEWSSSLSNIILEFMEIIEGQTASLRLVADESSELRKINETLFTKVQDLQRLIEDHEIKHKQMTTIAKDHEDSQKNAEKIEKSLENKFKRAMKNLEIQVQEAERRARQKELEIDKLKSKLNNIIAHEQQRKAKSAEMLDIVCSKGSISILREGSSGFGSLLSGKSKSKREHVQFPNSSIPQQIVLSLIEACAEYQETLVKRIAELENLSKQEGSEVMEENIDSKLAGGGVCCNRPFDDSLISDIEIESLELIKEIETTKSENILLKDNVQSLNHALETHQQTIENLRLELVNRPTYKQFRELFTEKEVLQQKLDDILALRHVSSASSTWKSHLSTSEKIKIDRKNHELHLHIIDSLPADIMRDTLQMVCRELDTPDISGIRSSLVKLKSVVRFVPRLQKFIETVHNYILSRNRTIEKELYYPISYSMHQNNYEVEDDNQCNSILSILHRWWKHVQDCINLKSFFNSLCFEFFRGQKILELSGKTGMQPEVVSSSSHLYNEESIRQDFSRKQETKSLFENYSESTLLKLVRDLVDLQIEIIHNDPSLLHVSEFVKSRPDIFVNTIVNHFTYLFNLSDLRNVLPKMNELYLLNQIKENGTTTVVIDKAFK